MLVFLAIAISAQAEGSAWSPDKGDGAFANAALYADYPDPNSIRIGNGVSYIDVRPPFDNASVYYSNEGAKSIYGHPAVAASASEDPSEAAEMAVMQRGRPRLNTAGTTFVTDNGQLLRGHFTSTEWSDPPPRENLAAIKNLGSNAVHLYAEVFDPDYPAAGSQAPGYAAERIDQVVEDTRELGLYLVMTIGNGGNNGSFNYDYVLDFWNFYAPRYKDETHVLYEIQNEPVAWSPPYSQAALQMELDAYNAIRSHAPDTPALLFSYSVLGSGEAALQDLEQIGDDVDWSNAGIAFHGYAGYEDTAESIQVILDAGYPTMMTEFTTSDWGYSIDVLDLELTVALERKQISWLSFLHIPPNFINEPVTDPATFREVVDKAGLAWTPDFGSWPVARGVFGNEGLPRETASEWIDDILSGVLRIEAEVFDEGGQNVAYFDRDLVNRGGSYRTSEGVDISGEGEAGDPLVVSWTEDGEWLEYTLFVKEAGYYDVAVRYAASGQEASLRAIFNGIDATGAMALPSTGGSGNWDTQERQVFLEYGRQKLRLFVERGGFDLDWVEISPSGSGPIPDGTYRFVNRKSGLALRGDPASGSVSQSPYAGEANEWVIRHTGAGQYQVRFAERSRFWSVFYQNNGEPLDLVGWWNLEEARQRFLFLPAGNGYYDIRVADGGLSLEMEGAATEAGALTLQHRYEAESHQQWAIQTASSMPFPTGLRLSDESGGYLLSWDAVAGASGYNVKRSSEKAGPYAALASGVAETTFLDDEAADGQVYYYVVSAVSGSQESLDSAPVAAKPPRLFASFGFDEAAGRIVSDAYGGEWAGELVGGVDWAEGREGGSLAFDGLDGHARLSDGIVSELDEITVSTWVYLDSRPFWSRLFDFGSGTGNYMFMTPNGGQGTYRFAITSGSGEQVIDGDAPLPLGEWLHLAVTLDGAAGVLYLNGEAVGRNEAMTLAPSDLGDTNQNYLGRSQWPDPYLHGRIDDFRIYTNALEADSVRSLYEAEPRPPISQDELRAPAIEIRDGLAHITIRGSVAGRGYRLVTTEDLSQPNWTAVGPTRFGDGSDLELSLPLDSDSDSLFFRIRIFR